MTHATHKLWQENATSIFAVQSAERRENDDRRVKNICDILSQTPTGKQIMDWVDANDVNIWMDYECTDVGGYCIPGANTACLNAHVSDKELVVVLAHELRHVWQSSQGFIATLFQNSKEYVLNTRFIEADATAFELQVYKELKDLDLPHNIDRRREGYLPVWSDKNPMPDFLKNGTDILYAGFIGWFTDTSLRNGYDGGSINRLEILLGLKDDPNFGHSGEYIVDNGFELPDHKGVNQRYEQAFLKLGQTFDQKNYLSSIPAHLLDEPLLVDEMSKHNKERLDILTEAEYKQRKQGLLPPVIRMPMFKARCKL